MCLAKIKLNKIGLLISKALNDLYISHAELVVIHNVVEENEDMEEKIKNSSKKQISLM